jgi:hypothetical protein
MTHDAPGQAARRRRCIVGHCDFGVLAGRSNSPYVLVRRSPEDSSCHPIMQPRLSAGATISTSSVVAWTPSTSLQRCQRCYLVAIVGLNTMLRSLPRRRRPESCMPISRPRYQTTRSRRQDGSPLSQGFSMHRGIGDWRSTPITVWRVPRTQSGNGCARRRQPILPWLTVSPWSSAVR